MLAPGYCQRILPASCLDHFISLRCQFVFQKLSNVRLIVHDQHLFSPDGGLLHCFTRHNRRFGAVGFYSLGLGDNRQDKRKLAASIQFALRPDPALMVLDDFFTDCESEAGTPSTLTSPGIVDLVKLVEDARQMVLWN